MAIARDGTVRSAPCTVRRAEVVPMNDNAAERLLRETDDFRDAQPVVDVAGLSSPRVCALLNRLVASLPPDEHYLEVGTWKGLTLLSAAWGNADKVCIACDKFRLWGRWTGF